MAAAHHAHPPTFPPPLASTADLAAEVADAFHLIAACLSRDVRVPDSVLNRIDDLLQRAQFAGCAHGEAA